MGLLMYIKLISIKYEPHPINPLCEDEFDVKSQHRVTLENYREDLKTARVISGPKKRISSA